MSEQPRQPSDQNETPAQNPSAHQSPLAQMTAAVDNWQARTPSTLEGAERYSRFVRAMRILLPTAAVALTSLIILLSIVNKPNTKLALTYESSEETAGLVAMTAPKFSGLDPDGRFYVVTADQALRPPGKLDKVELTKVHAEIKEDGEARLALNADKATVDADNSHLIFGPAVWVDLQDGFIFETNHAFADLSKGIVEGETPVRGESPFGTFAADRFELDRADQVVRLNGHVAFTINPAALQYAPDSLEELNDRRAIIKEEQ